MKQLLIFTIGPVQSFIYQARKTRDLKNGSMLLSYLIQETAEKGIKDFNADIIFPKIIVGEKNTSLPNRFLASIEVKNVEEAKHFGIELEKFVHDELTRIGKNVLTKLKYESGKDFYNEYISQIMAHLEVYWAFQSLENCSYESAYFKVEQNLGIVKNARLFNQLPKNENGRKCSVSGERDALAFGKFEYGKNKFPFPDRFVKAEKAAIINNFEIGFNAGEGLSAVNLMKRFWQDEKFPSTADIAMGSFEDKLKAEGIGETFNDYKGLYGINYDGQLLFEENLTEHYFLKKGLYFYLQNSNGKPLFEKMKEDLKNLLKTAKEKNIRPSSYYAFISFDGDEMGKWFKGKMISKDDDLQTFHRTFGERLKEFSKEAIKNLIAPKGIAVYAGGDDFIGFINLDYLFPVLLMLRKQFQDLVNIPMKTKYNLNLDLTFSAGLVISHYKTPLSEVINEAKNLEKEVAKNDEKGGRNALALRVIKHAGERQLSWLNWGKEEENLKTLQFIVKQLQENFSNNFIGILARELYNLYGNGEGKIPASYIIETEINRSVKQSLLPGKSIDLIPPMTDAAKAAFSWTRTVPGFIHLLEIADFLKKETNATNNH